jgi:hypothetical protein
MEELLELELVRCGKWLSCFGHQERKGQRRVEESRCVGFSHSAVIAHSALSSAISGFNYLYRRTATPSTTAPTPQSATSSLPPAQTKTPTPVPAAPSSVQSNGTSANAEAAAASPANQASSQPEFSNGPRTNGTSAADSAKEKQQQKKQQKKEREKERKKEEKERERVEKDTGSKEGSERKEASPHQAKPSTSSVVPGQDGDPLSPADSGTGSGGGTRTPTGPPRRRNPWTLFMKLPGPCNETEVREFFLSAKDGVSRSSA